MFAKMYNRLTNKGGSGLIKEEMLKEKDLLWHIGMIQGKLWTRQTKGSQPIETESPTHVTRQTPSKQATEQDMNEQ